MAEITLNETSKQVRDVFNKGFSAFERGNLDYAQDLLMSVVKMEPRFLQARKYLRAVQMQKYKQKKKSAFSRMLGGATQMPAYLKASSLVKSGKGEKAMIAAEELFNENPLDLNYAKLFARAAALASLPEAAIQTLEIFREAHPDDISILNLLAHFYVSVGRTRSARECLEQICAINPNDPDALKALKDALALDSISTDGWSEAKTYRDVVKDTDEAQLLEQEQKAVKTDSDVDNLIRDTLSKIEQEPGNINYYRSLARLYSQRNLFEEAASTIQKAIELSPGDPELDHTLSIIHAQHFDFQISQIRESGDEAAAEAKVNEKAQFMFDNLQQRILRYPNDLKLKYEWGVTLYENDYFNDAIQQFQLSQRSPNHRILSLFHLALCFKEKKQYDIAAEQLEKAGSEIHIVDETKKRILYELGSIYEILSKPEKAMEYYKQIYQVDIGYRDVSQKVESFYSNTQT